MHNVNKKCSYCDGTGVSGMPNEQGVCPRCAGITREFMGEIDMTDIESDLTKCLHRLKKIMDKLEITE